MPLLWSLAVFLGRSRAIIMALPMNLWMYTLITNDLRIPGSLAQVADIRALSAHLTELWDRSGKWPGRPLRRTSIDGMATCGSDTQRREEAQNQSSGRSPDGAILTSLGSNWPMVFTRSCWAAMTSRMFL